MSTGSRRPPLALVAAGSLVALVALAPAAYLLLRAGFSLDLVRRELDTPNTLPLVWHTVSLLLGVCLGTAVLGVGLAVLVARTTLPWPRLWIVLFTLPLGVPSFVSSYAWVTFGYAVFPQTNLLFGYRGAVAILTLTLYPYVFLPTVTALRRLDPAQEEAARALGRGPIHAFARVTLPQLRPAILTGLLINALHILAEYGAVQMLNYSTLTTAIVQRATVLGEPESARALAVVLALGALVVLVLERVLRGRARPVHVGAGTPRPPMHWQLGRSWPVWVAVCLLVVLAALAVPLGVTVTGMARQLLGQGAGVDVARLVSASANTVLWAGSAAILATVCALPVTLLAVRHPGRFSTLVERATWVAHALPGVIMALALVYLSVNWLYPLYQTASLLVIAYVIMFLPLAVGSQRVGVAQASRQLDEISHSLGRGALATFRRITLPLALPAIGVGALLVALDAGKELTTTLLMRPTGEHSLATALWATTDGEVLDFTAAAPYGLALLLIGILPAVLLARSALRS